MSRWSGRESPAARQGVSRSPQAALRGDEDGDTQPVAALVAVVAVCLALSGYAVGVDRALPDPSDRDRGIAKPTLERVTDAVRHEGVVRPAALPDGPDAGPEGYEVNVTLSVDDRTWSVGPRPPGTAESAARPVSVERGPGEVVPGRLRVEVWT